MLVERSLLSPDLIYQIGIMLQELVKLIFCTDSSSTIRFLLLLRRKLIIATNQKPNQNFGNKNRQANNKNGDLVNEFIRFPEVLVIGPNGESFGVMSRYDAIRKAESFNLDLLCVHPTGKPPVCKILNYGKYRFEAQKKAKEAKKNQKIIEVKEIQLTPQIGEHDLLTKAKAANKFLEDGNKIKVGVRFKGRQLSHVEVGENVLNKFIELVKDNANVEKAPFLEGKWLTCMLSSKIKK